MLRTSISCSMSFHHGHVRRRASTRSHRAVEDPCVISSYCKQAVSISGSEVVPLSHPIPRFGFLSWRSTVPTCFGTASLLLHLFTFVMSSADHRILILATGVSNFNPPTKVSTTLDPGSSDRFMASSCST
ncbi:hypothetical protein L207DRAFT_248538 [Hyaloscypha variabilis F]|uniref:Uncharacterized protein n=1 Tax=Hyaloscypha variabilis (strain UAMH 11265 / GT02V1 / F) TaxID=1149755 RepID=A0A2J6S334_HYAVF|nr:hypothetical protein L207DRAFT_248538 [Hyaloscypha variabilis F]